MSSRMEPVIITSQPLTSSSKLVPRALFHRSRRRGHTRLYRLPSSAKRTESKLPAFPIFPFVFLQPGVRSFRMDDTGKVHVSGYIEPNVLLKCLRKNGKEAHLVHWQYGECSTNLYQNNSYQNSGFQRGGYQNGGYHQGGYGGYDNNNGNGNNVSSQTKLSPVNFTPEAEKALEWKDYLSLFFVSDDEFATLWPSVCRILVPIFVNPRPSDVIGPLQELVDSGQKRLYKNVVYSDSVKHFFQKAHDGKATIDFAKF
ncbi:hypothetical protein Tco_0849997 [Tanacetum coccineum]